MTFAPDGHGLGPYFSELQGLPMLSPPQELALAREIEALEIAHWTTLLSYRPALAVIAAAVAPRLPAPTPRFESLRKRTITGERDPRWARAVKAAAQQLRELDVGRAAVSAAGAEVRKVFATDRRARHYLARISRARDAQQRAKGRFVAANLRLVISMARRYHRGLLPLADLIQEGNLGLMQAVERYDHRRGFRFSTYAAWWIRHGITRALADKARLVRVPVHTLDSLSQIARASGRSEARTGIVPSLEELSSQTGMSKEKLVLLESEGLLKQPVSLDRSLRDESEQTLHDVLRAPDQTDPDETLDLASWRADLDQLLRGLTSIESAILRFRFGLDGGEELTLRQIGDKYNLSRERIRQLQEEALTKLRGVLKRRARQDGSERASAA